MLDDPYAEYLISAIDDAITLENVHELCALLDEAEVYQAESDHFCHSLDAIVTEAEDLLRFHNDGYTL